jgi:ABC-type transporter MlaC component
MNAATQFKKRNLLLHLVLQFVFSAITVTFAANLFAAQTTLTWDPPVNADGTPFTGVSGYNVHMGNVSGTYTQNIDVGNTTSYALNNLTDGTTYYFAVTDYDAAGDSSGYSNEVSRTFPPAYSLTATAGTGGSITPVGSITASTATNGTSTITSVTVTQGATQSFSVTPNAGFNIADVTVDGISVGKVTSYTFTNVSADHTLTANFTSNTISTYSISAAAGTNGSITPSGTATVNSGASQVYTISPAGGYKIADVKVDGVSVGAVASYTFSNVTANHTIAATFSAVTTSSYSIRASAGFFGKISPSGTTKVAGGASQTYTITPRSGFMVADVKVDGVSVGAVASYTFSNVTAKHTIVARFIKTKTT